MRGLFAFGGAMFIAGLIIYPRPTLFVVILLAAFLLLMSDKEEPPAE